MVQSDIFLSIKNPFNKILNFDTEISADQMNIELESVAGPVIQANGRLTFEGDLRSGGLLYFTTQ